MIDDELSKGGWLPRKASRAVAKAFALATSQLRATRICTTLASNIRAIAAPLFDEARRRRASAIALAALLNGVFLWIAVLSVHNRAAPDPRELQLILGPAPRIVRPDLPAIPDIAPPVLEPPAIVIDDPHPAPEAIFAPPSMVLAPRPDPGHPNPQPAAADLGVSASAGAANLLLRVLVLPDGSVGEAVIVRSSGRPNADAAIIRFVRDRWRFLPAQLRGGAIQYWTTITIPL